MLPLNNFSQMRAVTYWLALQTFQTLNIKYTFSWKAVTRCIQKTWNFLLSTMHEKKLHQLYFTKMNYWKCGSLYLTYLSTNRNTWLPSNYIQLNSSLQFQSWKRMLMEKDGDEKEKLCEDNTSYFLNPLFIMLFQTMHHISWTFFFSQRIISLNPCLGFSHRQCIIFLKLFFIFSFQTYF